MTEQEIEQDRNCHYDLQSSIDWLSFVTTLGILWPHDDLGT